MIMMINIYVCRATGITDIMATCIKMEESGELGRNSLIEKLKRQRCIPPHSRQECHSIIDVDVSLYKLYLSSSPNPSNDYYIGN